MHNTTQENLPLDGWQRLYKGFVFLLVICVIGVSGYTIAGWKLIDSVYMVVITIFGVGYTEVGPVDSMGLRLFTIALIISGCSALIYILGGFFQFITEGEFNRILGDRKMSREIACLADHVIICGYGRLGRNLAKQMKEADVKAVILDTSEERVLQAAEEGYLAYQGDASSEETLEAVHIDTARALACVLPQDAMNVFVTLTARAMNYNLNILARGEKPTSEMKLYQAGANRVVIPTRISAQRLAHMITKPSVTDFFAEDSLTSLQSELDNIGVIIDQLKVPHGSPMVQRTINDLETNGDGGIMVVAVRHQTGETTRNPKKDYVVKEDETLLVLGMTEDLPELKKSYDLESTKVRSDEAAFTESDEMQANQS